MKNIQEDEFITQLCIDIYTAQNKLALMGYKAIEYANEANILKTQIDILQKRLSDYISEKNKEKK
jgi:hypothetical protein